MRIEPMHEPFCPKRRMAIPLAALAFAKSRLMDTSTSDIRRRTAPHGLSEDQTLDGLRRAREAGLVRSTSRGEKTDWHMTEAGWSECGIQKPMGVE